ncbi:MAG: hypothetical protein WKG07_04440 [Hymenobacter sp.]
MLSREQGESDLLLRPPRPRQSATELLQSQLPTRPSGSTSRFICGPEEMIHGVRQALAEAGVARAARSL